MCSSFKKPLGPRLYDMFDTLTPSHKLISLGVRTLCRTDIRLDLLMFTFIGLTETLQV